MKLRHHDPELHIARKLLLKSILCLYSAAGAGGVGSGSVLKWLAAEAPDTALSATVTATAALWWPDESVGTAAKFCRSQTAYLAQTNPSSCLAELKPSAYLAQDCAIRNMCLVCTAKNIL